MNLTRPNAVPAASAPPGGTDMEIILASGSPRRSEILGGLGLNFSVVLPEADESSDITGPEELTAELARRKALSVARRPEIAAKGDECLVIGCDTVVFCDGEILGKPHTAENAALMLRKLSGKTHRVVSGLCLIRGEKTVSAFDTTDVTFDELSDEDIDVCVRYGAPEDKAGAYAIQGIASLYIRGIAGDYFNVVGLPVHCLKRTLESGLGLNISDMIGGKDLLHG